VVSLMYNTQDLSRLVLYLPLSVYHSKTIVLDIIDDPGWCHLRPTAHCAGHDLAQAARGMYGIRDVLSQLEALASLRVSTPRQTCFDNLLTPADRLARCQALQVSQRRTHTKSTAKPDPPLRRALAYSAGLTPTSSLNTLSR
jgi:hypothetical protein